VSIRIVNKVLHHGPDEPHLQLLLLVLATHANEHGQAWPTITRLAHMTRVDQRTTSRSIQQLEKQGWVAVTRQHSRANRYQIDLDRLRDPDAHVIPDAHVGIQTIDPTPTSGHPDAHVGSAPDAHVGQVVRTVKEPPRSGVSPPPNGRRPTLTPEETHHRAEQARHQLTNRARPPPPSPDTDPNPNGRRQP